MSGLFVEKVLDEETFAAGAIALGPAEAERLGLPAHPAVVEVEHADGPVAVEWTSGLRRLGGETFRDLIEMYGQIDGLIRIHGSEAEGTPLVLQFLARPRSGVGYRGLIQSVAKTSTTSKARTSRKTVSRTTAAANDRNRVRRRDEFDWHGSVGLGRESIKAIKGNIRDAGWDPVDVYDLRVEGEALAAVSGFDELLALDLATVDHMPHQEATALKVLARLRGRAVLADEVGLGKTIEAGLIMKELMIRGMAKRVLVVCPASLREQWREELSEKFEEEFAVVLKGTDDLDQDLTIISKTLATMNIDRITKDRWDLVIIDEAHLMSGPTARRSRELLQRLESRYALYLTATPVQNDLLELYRLVDTLRPGTFTSQRDFKNRFMGANPREPKNPQALRELISDVMVRTTRASAGLDRVARIAKDIPVTLSPPERQAYDLCVTTLRRHMNDPNDHLRRRHLAHRLTTSPRALGQTARNMSSVVTDPEARRILADLADLCAEFGITNRQKKLMDLTTKWVGDPEKGRVLIFTQHTDTLEDILRVLDLSGIHAVPFHGGMAPKAKQDAIRKFKAGKGKGAPVMVSTESGAVGLNLQFANCVVNYDLPWNPMRIEQRIGRVHRVTQTRDVYVANIFARDTIDESVYILLHDKLRMFELLFGQVTTILGELDDTDTAGSFQNQVMDALLARDDPAMAKRIEALGKKVDKAYQSAQAQMASGGRNLTSLVFDTSHRAGMKKGGATELAPSAVKRDRQRRAAVERFVRQYLDVIGAEITWESAGTKTEPGFLSARLPEAARAALGDREEIHLAFGGEALANHAEAELCAVGTEVFEQIVHALADHGDLVAEVPDESLIDAHQAWFAGAEGVRYLTREFEDPAGWSTESVWKVRNSVDLDGDDVITAVEGEPEGTGNHRALTSGEVLPAKRAATLVDAAVKAAIPQIAEVASAAQRRIDAFAASEQARLADYYDDRLHELKQERSRTYVYERIEELETQIKRLTAERRKNAEGVHGTAEVQADLLAMRFVASPMVHVRETWRTDEGEEFSLRFEWNIAGPRPTTYLGSDGVPATTVAHCTDGHVLDATKVRRCPGCDEVRCTVCAGGVEFSECVVCGVAQCQQCLTANMCQPCGEPTVEPHATPPLTVSLGQGASVLVTHQRCVLRREDGEALKQLTANGRKAARLPRYAELSSMLGTEIGIMEGERATFELPANEIELERAEIIEWYVDPSGGPDISLTAAQDLWPESRPRPAPREVHDDRLPEGWADRLLRRCELAPGPAVVVETTLRLRSLVVVDGRISVRERVVRADGSIVVRDHATEIVAEAGSCVLRGPGLNATLTKHHRSVRLESLGGLLLVPRADVSAADEVAIGALAEQFGFPGSSVMAPADGPALTFAEPFGDVTLEHREVRPVWSISDRPADHVLERWPAAFDRPEFEGRGLVAPVTLDHALAALGDRASVTLERKNRVIEQWRSPAGEVTLDREFDSGSIALPMLDDTGEPAAHFSVDTAGHLHEIGEAWSCGSCGSRRCRACGDSGRLDECSVCSQLACGSCRTDSGAVTGSCVVCGVAGCTACGWSIDLVDCQLCQRTACSGCTVDGACSTCHVLAPFDDAERALLPAALNVAEGPRVLGARDRDGLVVVIKTAARLELAIVDEGKVRSWWSAESFGATAILTLETGRALGGVGDLELDLTPPDSFEPDADQLVISDGRRPALEMRVIDAGARLVSADGLGAIGPGESAEEGIVALALTRRFPNEGLRPTASGTSQAQALTALGATIDASRTPPRLWLGVVEQLDVTAIAPDGIAVTTGSNDEPRRTLHPWAEPDEASNETWRRFPGTLTHVVTAGQSEAALLACGPHRFLLLRQGGAVRARRIDRVAAFPEGLIAAAWLGTGAAPLAVTAFVSPGDPPQVQVAQGQMLNRSWHPIIEPAEPGADTDDEALHRVALSAPDFDNQILLTAERPDDIPEQLRRSLGERVEGSIDLPTQTVSVGYRAEDAWTNGLLTVTVRHERRPGDLRATIEDAPARVLGPVISIDRNGHLADVTSTCPYCSTSTCDACADRVRACGVCDQPICGACATNELQVCLACDGFERLGILARRRLQDRPKVALSGRDFLHSVAIVPMGGGRATVTVTDADGTSRTFVRRLSAGVAARCDQVAKATVFT